MKEAVYWILGLFLLVIGIFRVAKPEETIYRREHWRFENFEPSETYIKMERFSGIVSIVLSIVIFICIFNM